MAVAVAGIVIVTAQVYIWLWKCVKRAVAAGMIASLIARVIVTVVAGLVVVVYKLKSINNGLLSWVLEECDYPYALTTTPKSPRLNTHRLFARYQYGT